MLCNIFGTELFFALQISLGRNDNKGENLIVG